MKSEFITAALLAFIGAFALSGSVMNWNWFMESRKAAFFVKILGRNGTRILYGIIGLALLAFGIYGFFHPELMHSRRHGF